MQGGGSYDAFGFSRSGRELVAGSRDGQILVVGLEESGKEPKVVRKIHGHGASIEAVAFSRDGARLLTGSRDGEIKIWDFNTGLELDAVTVGMGEVRDIAFALDDRALIVGNFKDDARETGVLVVPDDRDVGRARRRELNRNYERGWVEASSGHLAAARPLIEAGLRELSLTSVDAEREVKEIARAAALNRIADYGRAEKLDEVRGVLESSELGSLIDADRRDALKERIVRMGEMVQLSKAAESEKHGSEAASQGKHDDAISQYGIAVEIYSKMYRETGVAPPRLLEVYLSLGVEYYEKAKFEKSLENWRAAAEAFPTDWRSRSDCGFAYFELGKLDEALSSFQNAIALAPKEAEALAGVAIVLNELGRKKKAITFLRQAVQLSRNYGSVQGLRAAKWTEKQVSSAKSIFSSLSNK